MKRGLYIFLSPFSENGNWGLLWEGDEKGRVSTQRKFPDSTHASSPYYPGDLIILESGLMDRGAVSVSASLSNNAIHIPKTKPPSSNSLPKSNTNPTYNACAPVLYSCTAQRRHDNRGRVVARSGPDDALFCNWSPHKYRDGMKLMMMRVGGRFAPFDGLMEYFISTCNIM
jgi:hypothetical protein